MQSKGGPLYDSVADIPKKDKNKLDKRSLVLLGKILPILNEMEDDTLLDAIETIQELFPDEENNVSGGKRKTRKKRVRKGVTRKNRRS